MKRRRQKPASKPSSAPKRKRFNQYYRDCIAASFCPADTSGPRIPTLLRQFSDQCPVKSHRHWLNLLHISCEKQRCLVRNCATGMHFAQTHGAKSLINSITMFLTYYVPKKHCVKTDSQWRQLLAALYTFHNYCARNEYIKDDHVLTSALYTLRNFRICTIPKSVSELAATRYWLSLELAPSRQHHSPEPEPQLHQHQQTALPPTPPHSLPDQPEQHQPPDSVHAHRDTDPASASYHPAQLHEQHATHPPTPAPLTNHQHHVYHPDEPDSLPAAEHLPHPNTYSAHEATSGTTAPPSTGDVQQQASPIATPSYPAITHAVHPVDRPASEDNDVTYVTEATTNTDLALPGDTHSTKLVNPAVKAALYNEATSAEPEPIVCAAPGARHDVLHVFRDSKRTSDFDAVRHVMPEDKDDKLVTADLHSMAYETEDGPVSHDPSSASAAVVAGERAQGQRASGGAVQSVNEYDVSFSAQLPAQTEAEAEWTQMQVACSPANELGGAHVQGGSQYQSHSDGTRIYHIDGDDDGDVDRVQQDEEEEYEAYLGGDTPLIVGQVMEDGWLMRSEDFDVDAEYTNAFLRLPVDVAKMGMRGMSLSGLQLGLRNGIWRPVLHEDVYVAKAYPPDDIFYY